MNAYPADIDPVRRAEIIDALRRSYDRFDPADFEPDTDGHYPPFGEGRGHSTLDWLYPATHLILEPRPGREAGDRTLGRKMILRGIRQGMFREDGHIADGVWHWRCIDGTQESPRDRNTSGFMGCALARAWANDPQRFSDWPEEDLAVFKDAVRRSADAGLRHWVRVGYINPQNLDFYLSWVAADLLDDSAIRARARERLRTFITYAMTTDAWEEYMSPTYMAVNLTGLAPLAHYVRGTDDEKTITDLLAYAWRLVGASAHAPTQEVCGPHSRAYGDTAVEMAGALYAWLHLAAPDVYPLALGDPDVGRGVAYDWFQKSPAVYDGLAAPGLYVPLGIPPDALEGIRNRFETPDESRELVEWIGRCAWIEPYDVSRPEPPAPRFRLATRYRTADYCLGSVNEQDGWLQRRSVLAYWNDSRGATTGVKCHVVVDAGEEDGKFLGDWLFMQAVELASAQSKGRVVGAFHTAPVVPAKAGETLKSRAATHSLGRVGMYEPKRPVGWFLGSHWRQSIEPEWRRQRLKRLVVAVTPIGQGEWVSLGDGSLWAFRENGIEAVVVLNKTAELIDEPYRTAGGEPVRCLKLWEGRDIDWDWLDLPEIFIPFCLVVLKTGGLDRLSLSVPTDSNSRHFEVASDELKVNWAAPSNPEDPEARTWRGWVDGKEILPSGYER